MVFSIYEWIACGGMLVPVGHWVFQTKLKKRIESQFVMHEKPFVYKELFEHQMFSPITLTTARFSQSSVPSYRITISEEALAVKQVFDKPMQVPLPFISELKYPVEVHTYTFPKGYVTCPTTKLLASSRDTLLKDVLQMQKGKTILVAGVSFTFVGISWLFYKMTPGNPAKPMFYGLLRNPTPY